jgi:hypothetical protein
MKKNMHCLAVTNKLSTTIYNFKNYTIYIELLKINYDTEVMYKKEDQEENWVANRLKFKPSCLRPQHPHRIHLPLQQ